MTFYYFFNKYKNYFLNLKCSVLSRKTLFISNKYMCIRLFGGISASLITEKIFFPRYNLINTKEDTTLLNLGPQHPAAHGVLRMVLDLDGEVIKSADPHIGLLHRATEKLLESKNMIQGLPYMDRLDYVSMMAQEHTYSLAFEKIINKKLNKRLLIWRVIFLEITRLLNHLLALTTHALDVGALTPFLWGFEEREKLMEFYERVSGARLHTAYIRPFYFYEFNTKFLTDIDIFSNQFLSRIMELSVLLNSNRIWRKRLSDVGILNKRLALNYSVSGPVLRASGLPWDLRKTNSYDNYESYDFSTVVTQSSDTWDRYFVRLHEMRQSIKLIRQSIQQTYDLDQVAFIKNHFYIKRKDLKKNMESVIFHFKDFLRTKKSLNQSTFMATEVPKGEFGLTIFLQQGFFQRCKIRSPGFFHLAIANYLVANLYLSDIVANIGSWDLVFGEIDR